MIQIAGIVDKTVNLQHITNMKHRFFSRNTMVVFCFFAGCATETKNTVKSAQTPLNTIPGMSEEDKAIHARNIKLEETMEYMMRDAVSAKGLDHELIQNILAVIARAKPEEIIKLKKTARFSDPQSDRSFFWLYVIDAALVLLEIPECWQREYYMKKFVQNIAYEHLSADNKILYIAALNFPASFLSPSLAYACVCRWCEHDADSEQTH